MGQFKQMPKMMTNEPTVILKLKKGGHVASEHKDADGHTNMKGKAFMSARADDAAEDGCAPKKPSMSDRRKAMSGALLNSKKGGKAVKKADGGMMGAPMAAPMGARGPIDPRKAAMLRALQTRRGARPAVAGALPAAPAMGGMPAMKKGGKADDTAQDKAMIKKAFKQHDVQEHKGAKGTKLALKSGGKAIDKFETRTTIEGNAGKFAKTKMHDGDKTDKAHGTTGVKEGKPAGYKTGGTITGNVSKFVKTKVVDGDRKDTAHGTGGVTEGKPAGYKKGGKITGNWENRPANDGDVFDPAHGTTGVRESNAGGYKKGGAAKKHFATGGSVNDAGKAVAMPKHFVSKPVSNSMQSGTFKKGGKVGKFAGGGSEDAMPESSASLPRDMSKGAYDATTRDKYADDMGLANTIRNAPSDAYAAIKKLLGIKPEAGAGRGFINPPMARRKQGGSAKR